MQHYSTSPTTLIGSAWQNRGLIARLVEREVVGRYRGSLGGMLWSLLQPACMLVIYTFVFSVVFRARWTTESDSNVQFALVLFAGLLVFNFFAECLNRAPGTILGNVSYVKKVIFPLDVLAWVNLGSALFHTGLSLSVWLLFFLILSGPLPLTALFLPVIWLPLMLTTLGLSWFLASLGVFLRDIGHIIGVVMSSLMFLSPVFYDASVLPATFQNLLYLNPLTLPVQQTRDVLIWGRQPDWQALGIYAAVSVLMAWAGFAWFQKTRRAFADVI